MNIKKYTKVFLTITILAIISTFEFEPTFAQEKTERNVPDKVEVDELLAKDYEYDLDSILYIKKGEKEPRIFDLNTSNLQGEFTSSEVLNQKNSDRIENYSKQDKLRVKLNELEKDTSIEYFQPVYLYTSEAWARSGEFDTPSDFDQTPSPSTGNHWYYELSNLRKLWQRQDCLNAGAGCGGSSNVTVAVIDTGLALEDRNSAWNDVGSTKFNFDQIPDMFTGGSINLFVNAGETPNNQIDDDSNGYIDDTNGFNSSNFILCYYSACTTAQTSETGHPNDDGGHGTYVTGLIASLVDNASGSVSPASKVTIMPIKANFRKSNSFGTLELYYAIYYAIDNGANIINMSLAGSSPDGLLEEALQDARDAGILVVASSGNLGGAVQYPAKYNSSTVAVGAVNPDNSRSSYSNYGSDLDLVAYVGQGGASNATYQSTFRCFTSSPNCYSSTDTSRYTLFSNTDAQYRAVGTSFAAPQVTAWAALIKSSFPTLEADELITYMQSYTIDLSTAGWDEQTGWGAVDYSMGVNLPPEITTTTPATNGVSADMTYSVGWSATDTDSDAQISVYFDTNNSGFDGYLSHVCKGLSEDSVTDACTADLRFLVDGTYYVYTCIDDGYNDGVCDYAPGNLAVAHVLQQIETGKVGVTNNLTSVTFASAFPSVPAVFTGEISEYGGQKFFVNIKNVTTTGFDIQLLENTISQYDIYHPPEVISWIAILNSDSNKQIGVANINNNWETISFTNGYGQTPKIFAQTQTENGPDIENIDLKDLTNNNVAIRVEEAPGWDGAHSNEQIAWMTFTNYGSSSQSAKTTGDHTWKSVTFSPAFAQKPILFGEVASEVGQQTANFDVRNLTKTGFEFRLDEDEFLHDLWHPVENVNWLAIPYTHPVRSTGNAVFHHNIAEVPFTKVLEDTPVLFTNIVTENGLDTVDADILFINEAGFKVRLEEDRYGGWDGIHANESVNWLAGKIGVNNGIEIGKTSINDAWQEITTLGTYSDPHFFASIQTENGDNTASPDIKNVSGDWFLRVEEDTRLGWDGIHSYEDVGWMVFDTPGVGCWGSKTLDSDGTWQDSINIQTEETGGSCVFSSAPYLFSQINTENGTDSVLLDIKNLTNTGFELRLEEEPNFYDRIHLSEKIVWLAL